MCLSIPAKISEILPDAQAIADLGGVKKKISILLVEDVRPGDYVLVHVGHALSVINPVEAKKTLALFQELMMGEPKGAQT